MLLSPSSGSLAYYTSSEILTDHPTPNLDIVNASDGYTLEKLIEGAALDIKLAMQNGANMDYVATIINRTIQLLEVLGEDAKKLFYAVYAIQLRNMFRRAGPEYRNAAQLLINIQKLTIIKGELFEYFFPGEWGVFKLSRSGSDQQKTYP